jgi:hypothetical protein
LFGQQRSQGWFIQGETEAWFVAENDAAVLDLLVHLDADRMVQVLHLGHQEVRQRTGRGCDDRGVADRAYRQVVGMREVPDAQKVGHAPGAADLGDVDRVAVDERAELFQAGEIFPGGDSGPTNYY